MSLFCFVFVRRHLISVLYWGSGSCTSLLPSVDQFSGWPLSFCCACWRFVFPFFCIVSWFVWLIPFVSAILLLCSGQLGLLLLYWLTASDDCCCCLTAPATGRAFNVASKLTTGFFLDFMAEHLHAWIHRPAWLEPAIFHSQRSARRWIHDAKSPSDLKC